MSSFQFYSREEYQSMSFNELVDYCLLLQEMAGAKDMECRSLTQRCADVEKKCKLLKKQNTSLCQIGIPGVEQKAILICNVFLVELK